MLRIALPNKGRLSDDVRQLFNDAGLEIQARGERALTASIGGEFEALFVRAQDIPEFVADGAADAGVTGWDLVSESGRPLVQLLDLAFGRCRLVIAAREESGIARLEDVRDGMRVASTFPKVTERFFQERGRRVELVAVSGAVEIAPHLGIADVVSDLTSTGSTLKVNGLRELATVLESSARLICREKLDAGARERLEELAVVLQSVIRARGQRYLMANLPRQALPQVREVLPGLNGPTVVDVMDGGDLVAVHAVVPTASVNRTIAKLRSLGGRGILVTKIERSVP